jgi:hypothetical protein
MRSEQKETHFLKGYTWLDSLLVIATGVKEESNIQ